MELREFVRSTIADIFGGVVDARVAVAEIGGLVVPAVDPAAIPNNLKSRSDVPPVLWGGTMLTLIEFDVALTQGERSGTKGGLGVFLGNVGIGGQASEDQQASSLSRIRFSIPVALPPTPRAPVAT